MQRGGLVLLTSKLWQSVPAIPWQLRCRGLEQYWPNVPVNEIEPDLLVWRDYRRKGFTKGERVN